MKRHTDGRTLHKGTVIRKYTQMDVQGYRRTVIIKDTYTDV